MRLGQNAPRRLLRKTSNLFFFQLRPWENWPRWSQRRWFRRRTTTGNGNTAAKTGNNYTLYLLNCDSIEIPTANSGCSTITSSIKVTARTTNSRKWQDWIENGSHLFGPRRRRDGMGPVPQIYVARPRGVLIGHHPVGLGLCLHCLHCRDQPSFPDFGQTIGYRGLTRAIGS